MYPQFTSELAAQRRRALTAVADRRRMFGRKAQRPAEAAYAAGPGSLARLVELPVRPDERTGVRAPAPCTTLDARVA